MKSVRSPVPSRGTGGFADFALSRRSYVLSVVPNARTQANEELLSAFVATLDPDRMRGECVTYRLEIADAGSWLLTVAGGRVTLAAGVAEAACVLRLDTATLTATVEGEQTMLGAFLGGTLAVEGDLLLVAKLDRFRRG